MDIFLNFVRHIEVNDMHNVLDIEAASGDVRGDQYRLRPTLEIVKGLLPLPLKSVPMNTCRGKSNIAKLRNSCKNSWKRSNKF